MIISMKKVTLLCLESEKEQTLKALRDLSIMHVAISRNVDTGDVAELNRRMAEINRAGFALLERKTKPGKPVVLDGAKAVDRTVSLLDSISGCEKTIDSLEKEIDRLHPWGNFNPKQIAELEKKGIHVLLCTASAKMLPEVPEGVSMKIIAKDSAQVYFILISEREIDAKGFNTVVLPEKPLADLEAERSEAKAELGRLNSELDALTGSLDALRTYKEDISARLEFSSNRESMEHTGTIAHLTGYVPVDRLENLRAAALKNGWALLIQNPEFGDPNVPTCIRKPKWLNIMDPLFDFIGVTPGYRENDVNLFFLIFFPIFFGMIIGDAVYGLLFLSGAIIGKIVLRNKPAARLPLNLFLLLSCCSIIWGVINGSWAGLPAGILPDWMHGWSFLTAPEQNGFAVSIAKKVGILTASMPESAYADAFAKASWSGKIIQWLCFFLAAVHLSSARFFKFATEISGNWRALGHIGWAMLLVANFFMAVSLIVFSDTFPSWGYYLYIVGAVLVIVTITFEEALNLPFAFIGSFTDVLSYIRLYAVGLAGSLIAIKFNEMGLMLTDGKSGAVLWFAMIALVLIALFGHLLNIALGFLSVLVHAIRLNTLEFSNHIGMQWGGINYHPFAKKTNSENSQK